MELAPRARSVAMPNRAIPRRSDGLARARSSLMTSGDFIPGDRFPPGGELADLGSDLLLVGPRELSVLHDRLASHDHAPDGLGLHRVHDLLWRGHRGLHGQRLEVH